MGHREENSQRIDELKEIIKDLEPGAEEELRSELLGLLSESIQENLNVLRQDLQYGKISHVDYNLALFTLGTDYALAKYEAWGDAPPEGESKTMNWLTDKYKEMLRVLHDLNEEAGSDPSI